MKTSNLLRTAATLSVALLLALPATAQAQQADFTTFVSIGDSLTAGFTNGCLVDYAQGDSWGAIIARAAGATYEQPIIKSPGLGPCMYLVNLAPTFGNRPNTGVPTNATLARPYNNLAVPGFKIHDLVVTNPTTAAGGLAYIILRGLGTELQQAASLKPSFLLMSIGHNDVLSPASMGTVIPCADPPTGFCTLTSISSINTDLDTIFSTMKAAQGGTGKGLVGNIGDVAHIPFFNTVSPILGVYPAGTPAAGQPIYALYDSCPAGFPACPVPAGSMLTLLAASYLQAGYGIPCAILAPTDPKQANCNKPLHDNIWVDGTGTVQAGVVLTPTEIATLRTRTAEMNYSLVTKGQAAGYKIWDEAGFFADMFAHGRIYGGVTIGTAFLSGGFFGYDGTHPTSLGYAIAADDMIQTINSAFGNDLPRVNMSPFIFNGDTSPNGGFPGSVLFAPTSAEMVDWATAIFGPDTWHDRLRYVFPDFSWKSQSLNPPEGMPISPDPAIPTGAEDR